jgi:hypothetical protein
MNARLNWILFAVIILLAGGNTLLFTGVPRWLTEAPRWLTGPQSASSPASGNEPSCLKVSDFYSVHLTTYFLAATGDGDTDPKDKAKRYAQYCDRVPGTGQAIFTIDLMEQEARDLAVAMSLSRYDTRGQLTLVKELPRNVHPGGVMTLTVPIVERGKYLLRLAFGEGKSKDDTIEMPILVGQ